MIHPEKRARGRPATGRKPRAAYEPKLGDALRPAELTCLARLAEGFSPKQIARDAGDGISPRTIEAHIAAARTKLGAEAAPHAVAIAIRRGLIPMDPSNDNVRAVAAMMKKRWHEDIALGVDEDTRWKNAAAGLIIAVNRGMVPAILNEAPKHKPAETP